MRKPMSRPIQNIGRWRSTPIVTATTPRRNAQRRRSASVLFPFKPNESPPATDAASFHKGEAAAIGIRIARRKKAPRFCVKREYLTQRREGAKKEKLDSRFRSEERRVGKEWVSTCRSRWSACH